MNTETVLSAVSVLVALGAVWVAKSARDEAVKANVSARSANAIARKANELSEDSNRVAKTAVDRADEANQLSADSNSIASSAADAAGEANKLSAESNSIAREAAASARAVPIEVAWDEALVALQALLNANPADPREPVGALLTGLRTRIMLLVDKLEWDGFDDWVAHEARLGVLLMREADAKGLRTGPLTVDDILEVNRQFALWVVAYTSNLRMFRKNGQDARTFAKLTSEARARWKAVCTRNGWQEEPEAIAGLVPLEDDSDSP